MCEYRFEIEKPNFVGGPNYQLHSLLYSLHSTVRTLSLELSTYTFREVKSKINATFCTEKTQGIVSALSIIHFILLSFQYTFKKIEKIRRMSSLSSQANRLQTVIRRKRKRAPFIEESQLSAQEPKKKKTKKNEEVVVKYGFECEHCPKDGTDDTDKQKADKYLQRLCLCKKKTYESDRKVPQIFPALCQI